MASSRWRQQQLRQQAGEALPLDEAVRRHLRSRGYSEWRRLEALADVVHLEVDAGQRRLVERVLSADVDLANKVVLNGEPLDFEVLAGVDAPLDL